LPDNFLAFELPIVAPEWKVLITGIEPDMIRDGNAAISEAPGLGVDLVEEAARDLLGRDDIYSEPAQ
jgi:L-alanine-DL-glutamate epimerase-like enolase superfamily enzyme